MTVETLVLIADSARARLFAAYRNSPWQLLRSFEHPRGAARERDLLADRPGRVHQAVGDGSRSAADPKTSPHDVEIDKFARQLAQALDEAVATRRPHRVVLVAPPRFLGHLRGLLGKPASALLGATVDQDLTAVAECELPARLGDVL
jgi:protein required for attachment to host cells